MTISRPNKIHSEHAKRLRNGHFLSNGTAKDLALTWSNCPICGILLYVKRTYTDSVTWKKNEHNN